MAKKTKKAKSTDFNVIEPLVSQAVPKEEVKKGTIKAVKTAKKVKSLKKEKTPKVKTTGLSANDYVVIDYPMDNEVIHTGHYSVRIGASDGVVEITFNKKDWHKCRHAGGYWWFDLSRVESGKKTVTARLIDHSTGLVKTTSKTKRVQIL